jgi:SAM-dependent methyltransferase
MSYREGAQKFYDHFGAKDDAQFYIELAHNHGDRTLELGVGTARLAIQLARDGIETWGIDNSRHMLNAAEANLKKEPLEVQNRVYLEHADVRDFDLGMTFGLVCFPSMSFDHILDRGDQLRSLENIKRHVSSNGVFAFELAHLPMVKADSYWYVERKPLNNRLQVTRTGYHKIDPDKRLLIVNMWYEIFEEGRMLERYYEGGEVYIHSVDGIKELLDETGFEIEAWYGGHDWSEFTSESEMMVIVARAQA